ncbi:MAG: hypothetical protein ACR2QR_12300 [Woeseiaceae bacterium]
MNLLPRIVVTCLLALTAAPAGIASPLFEGQSSLQLTIEAPFRELVKKRHDKVVYDAFVRYTDSTGEERVLQAQLSSRGNSRLTACEFPPLRLILTDSETAGTVFEGQTRLKMVTQCNKRSTARRWLLQELAIYRAYSEITDYAYRTRRLDVAFLEQNSSRQPRKQPAFFIERTGALAERFERDSIRPPTIQPEQHKRAVLAKNMLFQLLIANTDFSVKRGPEGEGCCHNGRVLAQSGQQADWVVVPYDFDQAGIINTDYAVPGRRLGIGRVRSRLYRGFCWQNDSLADAARVLRERRQAITAALVPTELSARAQSRVRRYIDEFYEIFDDPGELSKKITDKCRGPTSLTIRKTRTAADE